MPELLTACKILRQTFKKMEGQLQRQARVRKERYHQREGSFVQIHPNILNVILDPATLNLIVNRNTNRKAYTLLSANTLGAALLHHHNLVSPKISEWLIQSIQKD
ncbi:hypothetical protein N7G274_001337 [Stereocaulon virgatum]|uniref:Uncharacterized protein n=1 Tax=Stereocaulon virgatum TaxID=373712 RepID=A0ABR4AR36_9LECA